MDVGLFSFLSPADTEAALCVGYGPSELRGKDNVVAFVRIKGIGFILALNSLYGSYKVPIRSL
jgi:hypothetical protein